MPPSSSQPTPQLTIEIFPDRRQAGEAAAVAAAEVLRQAIARRGAARLMVGTGNSQLDLIRALGRQPGIAWNRVDAFHLDEYVGLPADHPAGFRLWIRTNFADVVRPRSISYLHADTGDADEVARDYSRRLEADVVDLAFVGIGENGHIAFNDPHVADFDDPLTVKRVLLDEACRRQQVGEGHFPNLDTVPREALTVTCSGLFRAEHWICCVPEARKAPAVRRALTGPIATECPGTLVRRHPAAAVFLDRDSAAQLPPEFVRASCRVHPPSPAPAGA